MCIIGYTYKYKSIVKMLKSKNYITILILMLIIILIGLFLFYFILNYFLIKTPEPQNIDEVIITLSRGECYGFCPVYSLTIYGNGTVKYIGERIYTIPKEDVQSLVDNFIEINYFGLEDNYKVQVTDASTIITSILINGRKKTISRYVGGPDKLKNLENEIDEIARTNQYIE